MSATFPQMFDIDLVVKLCKSQCVQELPLHQSLECQKLNWRVCCVGLNRFYTRFVSCCCRSRSPKNTKSDTLFWAWQLQKSMFFDQWFFLHTKVAPSQYIYIYKYLYKAIKQKDTSIETIHTVKPPYSSFQEPSSLLTCFLE